VIAQQSNYYERGGQPRDDIATAQPIDIRGLMKARSEFLEMRTVL
jgi:hypothetical protein